MKSFLPRMLDRLAFSFLVLAGFLAWEGYKGISRGGVNRWQIGLFFLGAGVSVGLAIRGLRERHRRVDDFDRD